LIVREIAKTCLIKIGDFLYNGENNMCSVNLLNENTADFYGSMDGWYENDDVYYKLVSIFESSIKATTKKDKDLFINDCAERTICSALMLQLDNEIKSTPFSDYYSDVEYNRNNGHPKEIAYDESQGPKRIFCDLILHSRGNNIWQDNLIAIEMKKSTADNPEKEKDRKRLMALTRPSYDDVWRADGKVLPEYVCRYILGVYIEIDRSFRNLHIEYYRNGSQVQKFKEKIY
jgi:hypothetical protein